MAAQVSHGAAAAGSSLRTIGLLMGRRMQSTFQVTHLEPGFKHGFKSLSGPLQVRTIYALGPAGDCTLVHIGTQASLADIAAVPEGTLEQYMQNRLGAYLAMLKSILEER